MGIKANNKKEREMSKSKRKEKTLNLACLSNVIGESFKVLGGRRETNRGEIESLAHICHVRRRRRRANNNRGPFCSTSSLPVFFSFLFSNDLKIKKTLIQLNCDRPLYEFNHFQIVTGTSNI